MSVKLDILRKFLNAINNPEFQKKISSLAMMAKDYQRFLYNLVRGVDKIVNRRLVAQLDILKKSNFLAEMKLENTEIDAIRADISLMLDANPANGIEHRNVIREYHEMEEKEELTEKEIGLFIENLNNVQSKETVDMALLVPFKTIFIDLVDDYFLKGEYSNALFFIQIVININFKIAKTNDEFHRAQSLNYYFIAKCYLLLKNKNPSNPDFFDREIEKNYNEAMSCLSRIKNPDDEDYRKKALLYDKLLALYKKQVELANPCTYLSSKIRYVVNRQLIFLNKIKTKTANDYLAIAAFNRYLLGLSLEEKISTQKKIEILNQAINAYLDAVQIIVKPEDSLMIHRHMLVLLSEIGHFYLEAAPLKKEEQERWKYLLLLEIEIREKKVEQGEENKQIKVDAYCLLGDIHVNQMNFVEAFSAYCHAIELILIEKTIPNELVLKRLSYLFIKCLPDHLELSAQVLSKLKYIYTACTPISINMNFNSIIKSLDKIFDKFLRREIKSENGLVASEEKTAIQILIDISEIAEKIKVPFTSIAFFIRLCNELANRFYLAGNYGSAVQLYSRVLVQLRKLSIQKPDDVRHMLAKTLCRCSQSILFNENSSSAKEQAKAMQRESVQLLETGELDEADLSVLLDLYSLLLDEAIEEKGFENAEILIEKAMVVIQKITYFSEDSIFNCAKVYANAAKLYTHTNPEQAVFHYEQAVEFRLRLDNLNANDYRFIINQRMLSVDVMQAEPAHLFTFHLQTLYYIDLFFSLTNEEVDLDMHKQATSVYQKLCLHSLELSDHAAVVDFSNQATNYLYGLLEKQVDYADYIYKNLKYFWELLGNTHEHLKDYDKAAHAFHNAFEVCKIQRKFKDGCSYLSREDEMKKLTEAKASPFQVLRRKSCSAILSFSVIKQAAKAAPNDPEMEAAKFKFGV